MAKFDIPASVSYNYSDLNNLQGVDTWDTNPDYMRASDMMNIVKKEGLHQVRHNVNQLWSLDYSGKRNLVKNMSLEFNDDTGFSNIYIDFELKPNTRYVLSFYKNKNLIYKINENLFTFENDLSTNDRTAYVVLSKETINSEYKTEKGWLCFETNESTSNVEHLPDLFVIDNGSHLYFDLLENVDMMSNVTNRTYIEDLIRGEAYYNDFGIKHSVKLFFKDECVYEYINPNIKDTEVYKDTLVSIRDFEPQYVGDNLFECNIGKFDIEKKFSKVATNTPYANITITFLGSITRADNKFKVYESYLHIIPYTIKNNVKTKYEDVVRGPLNFDKILIPADSKQFNISWHFSEQADKNVDEYGFDLCFDVRDDNDTYLFDDYINVVIPTDYYKPQVDSIKNIAETILCNEDAALNIVNNNENILSNILVETNNIRNEIGNVQVEESEQLSDYIGNNSDDDIQYPIKYVGKIEEYDTNGNPVPYYIKISEYLGEYQKENDSKLVISVWPTPIVKNIGHDLKFDSGFEKYKTSYKVFTFTNYGETGNRQGYYEHIEFDGKERVFTPIGILSFKCFTKETEDGYYQLGFDIENVVDNPYVPTVIYGSTPSGLDFTRYEAINLLGDKRKAQFLSDGTSTQYVLPEKRLDNYCKVSILNDSGLYEEMTTGFTLNRLDGVVTFNTAPSKSPVDGKDNVIIEYSKKPTTDSEDNLFNITSTSSDKMVNALVEITKETSSENETKIDVDFKITLHKGSEFDTSNTTYNSVSVELSSGSNVVYNYELTLDELSVLKNNGDVIKESSLSIDNDGSAKSRVWTLKINDTYNKNTTQTITTYQAGSKANDIGLGLQTASCLGFNWIGLKYDASVKAYVGSNTNGSDSYWIVTESVQLWVSRSSYLNCGAGSLYGVIDGEKIYAGSTGAMYASSTVYPGGMLSIQKRIPYNASKKSVSIGSYMAFGGPVNLSGRNYTEMSAGYKTLNLPTINLPKNVTTTTGSNVSGSGTSSSSYTETIIDIPSKLNYSNKVPGSARLACYYGTKCVTVYGYESDRRVFLTDGTNTDTFSGVTLDGTSSIYYFPDDNYRVLGEDTEIIGYALKDGYLMTFKRGSDSVYVRYGTTLNNTTQFPSSVVTRNLQVLTRPIQINDEVLVITRNGIESITYQSQEARANLRSYFINNYFQLSADYNYDKMSWYKEDNLLHIYLGNYEFTCDLIAKSYVREGTNASGYRGASTLQYQYEWFISKIPWVSTENPPVMTMYQPRDFERATSGIVYENQRAIGFNSRGIYELSYNDYKVDKFMRTTDKGIETIYIPIKAHYVTPFMNMGAINVAKTIKYIYINTRSKNGDMFCVGYIDENGYQETLERYYENIEDYKTKLRNSEIPFPKLIQIKSKIRKFMNVKLYIQNRAEMEDVEQILPEDQSLYGNTTFDRILIQYQVAGKYRGE